MIEVPSAVLTAERSRVKSTFLSWGQTIWSNTRSRWIVATTKSRVVSHAASGGALRHQPHLRSGENAQIPVIVCGEMASTPAYAVLLVGMGATDLSMIPAMIPRVRAVLSQIKTH